MLSIGKAQGSYYVSLAKDDYYTQGGEPNGIWHGQGADRLGFEGEIDKEEFLKLCDGVGKHGKELTQNAKQENRVAGWDLTFSAPKSVSVLWSQADFETRLEIQKAHFEAVKIALDYIEGEAGFTRRGKGGFIREESKLVFATFEHGTSRSQDPQLHTHAVTLNVGIREDGGTGALDSPHLYRHKMTAGALYRAELAHNLQEKLGVKIEKTKKAFEVREVSKKLIDDFSSRRKEILEAMKNANAKGAERASYFTMSTRERKAHVAREILFEKWQEVGKQYKFDLNKVIGQEKDFSILAGEDFQRQRKEELKREIVKNAVEKITERDSYFSTQKMVRETAIEGVGKISAGDAQNAVEKYLENEAVHLGRGRDGEFYFTTKEIDALEKRMLIQVEEAKAGWHKRPKDFREIAVNPNLSDEQKKALFSITAQDGSSIRVVSGMAGAGKTTLLTSAKKVWEAQGYEIKGASLASVAAKGLEAETGIESRTIHKTLFEIQKGNLRLTDKTILVIDEAGMVATKQMSELINEAKKAKAQLILVGDEKQLQPINAGNPFKSIGDRTGRSELQEIRRQKDDWAREAVKDFAFGEARRGLEAYARRDLLKVAENRFEAMEMLVKDWRTETTELKSSLMVAGTRADVTNLNRLAQAERLATGELGRKSIQIDNDFLHENDRVLFTKNDYFLKVGNGDLGTVSEVDRERRLIKVNLDNGNRVTIPVNQYEDIQLGYAVTTHKAQGKTVNRAFILVGGFMQDRELSYVQMSRSREETKIYTERAEVGDNLTELSKRMSKSRMKELAQDISNSFSKEQGCNQNLEQNMSR